MAASLKVEYLICPADDHYIFADGTTKDLELFTENVRMPKLTKPDRWPKNATKFQRAFANVYHYPYCFSQVLYAVHGDQIVYRWDLVPCKRAKYTYWTPPYNYPGMPGRRARQLVLTKGQNIENSFIVDDVRDNGFITASFEWGDGSGRKPWTMCPGLAIMCLHSIFDDQDMLHEPKDAPVLGYSNATWPTMFLKAIVKFKRLAARARDKANAPDGPAFKRVRREVVEEGRMRA
jgi:hypothetical protein